MTSYKRGRLWRTWLALAMLGTAAVAVAQTDRNSDSAQTQSTQTPEPITPIPLAPLLDPEKVALGKVLYSDRNLSRDRTVSCMSCHDTNSNGADETMRDTGPDGKPLPFNTSTVFNAGLNARLDWEGDAFTLEDQVKLDFSRSGSMGTGFDEILRRLKTEPDITAQFEKIYGHGPDITMLADAIASYEKTLVTPGAAFDRWLEGDDNALTPAAKQGYRDFKSFGCISCHQGVNVGGNLFEPAGIFHALGGPTVRSLRVPSLRNIATTSPYFDDGSVGSLSQAVQRMAFAQLDRQLSEQEVADIVSFLNSLTGNYQGRPVGSPKVPQ